jgi:hypothetical protein
MLADMISNVGSDILSPPTGREEIRNPYQTGVPAQGKRKRSKVPVKKLKSDNKEQVEKSKVKGKDSLSTQKLVEASVPKVR